MLLLLSLVPLVQAPLSPAHLHPASLDLYVEIPNLGEFVALTRTAPIGQLAHDAEFLGLFAGLLRQPELEHAALAAQLDAAPGLALGGIGLTPDALDNASLSLSINGLRTTLPAAMQRAAHWTAAHAQVSEWSARIHNAGSPPAKLADLADARGEAPRDPWGREYVYTLDAGTQQFTLLSLGADGAPGGSGDATDVGIDTDRAEALVPLVRDAFGITIALRFAAESSAEALQQSLLTALEQRVELGAPGPDGERTFSLKGLPAWIDVDGSTLLIGEGNVTHSDVLARARGSGRNSAGARSVLESAHARLGEPRERVVWLGYQSTGWLDLVGGLVGALGGLGAAGDASPFAALTGLLPATGGEPRAASETAWRTEFDGKQFHARSVEPIAAQGIGALLGRTPIDAAALQSVPAAANAFWATSIDGPEIGKQLFTLLGRQSGLSGAEWVASLERTSNVRLDKALFDNIGSTALVYAMPWKAIGLPPVVAVVPLRDPALFAASVEHLGALLPADLVEAGAKVSTRPYREIPITTISLGSGGGPIGMPIQPALCVLDGQLFVSTSPTPLKDEIKRRKEAAGERHPALNGMQQQLAGASSVSHVDIVAIVSDVITIASNAAKMFGGDNLPIDLSKLPKRELLSKYLGPTSSRTELRDGWAYSTSQGSFGPETPLFLVGAMGASSRLVERAPKSSAATSEASDASSNAAQAPPAGDAPAPAEQTTLALRQVRGALAVYKNENGKYPGALVELTAASANYPRGYLSSGALPDDGWGQALHYELVESGARYRLWSIGADGADQGGAGDDVNAQPVR